MSGKTYTIEEIKSIVEPIARKYGVAQVYLFGSYARGEATEKSNVHLRVDKGSLKVCLHYVACIQKLKKLCR